MRVRNERLATLLRAAVSNVGQGSAASGAADIGKGMHSRMKVPVCLRRHFYATTSGAGQGEKLGKDDEDLAHAHGPVHASADAVDTNGTPEAGVFAEAREESDDVAYSAAVTGRAA